MFSNPIVGGGGNLVRDRIRSPNYVPGVSGWTINQDGTAEFSDIIVRGRAEARNGNAFIALDPTIPSLEFNPNDTVFVNGQLQFTDGGTSAETILTGAYAPGQGVPAIHLSSTASVDGTLRFLASLLQVDAPATEFAGPVDITNGPLTITNGLATQSTWGKQFVRKTVSVARPSTTALTADPILHLPMEANAFYEFKMYVIISSPTNAPDMNVSVVGPAGSSGSWTPNGLDPTVAAGVVQGIIRRPNNGLGGTRAVATVGTGANATVALITGCAVTGGTPGDLELHWAQLASTVENTEVAVGSYMTLERVQP